MPQKLSPQEFWNSEFQLVKTGSYSHIQHYIEGHCPFSSSSWGLSFSTSSTKNTIKAEVPQREENSLPASTLFLLLLISEECNCDLAKIIVIIMFVFTAEVLFFSRLMVNLLAIFFLSVFYGIIIWCLQFLWTRIVTLQIYWSENSQQVFCLLYVLFYQYIKKPFGMLNEAFSEKNAITVFWQHMFQSHV